MNDKTKINIYDGRICLKRPIIDVGSFKDKIVKAEYNITSKECCQLLEGSNCTTLLV